MKQEGSGGTEKEVVSDDPWFVVEGLGRIYYLKFDGSIKGGLFIYRKVKILLFKKRRLFLKK